MITRIAISIRDSSTEISLSIPLSLLTDLRSRSADPVVTGTYEPLARSGDLGAQEKRANPPVLGVGGGSGAEE